MIAFLPEIYKDYFKGKFYSKTAVCLALPLTDERSPGWLYSISIFIGLNLVMFVLIAIGQLMIYIEMKQHASVQVKKVSRANDLKVARNLLLVVATDFLCWFPIGIMGRLISIL
jgi:leucine-rich repeat-containing G protein-coupled receptor 7/leucine-rich repeat-containing G protein-coupled receptor 8